MPVLPHKYANIVADQRVALVAGWDYRQTMQIKGIADLLSGDTLAICKDAYFAVWPDGRERERWPHIAYERVAFEAAQPGRSL